ncbi:MAG: hypothetical protein IT379_05230 [Deltaproteobacteria bacterium]|nr:hypothetical protein [Deltaproteobacteria bacterium]
MRPFGDFDLRVDAWDVEYGAGMNVEEIEQATGLDVKTDVEVSGRWHPITPSPTARARRFAFVDGVRRVDVRVHDVRAGKVVYGAFGSLAVGGVVLEDGEPARFEEPVVERLLVLGSGQRVPATVTITDALAYEPHSTDNSEADGPLTAVQHAMLRAEASYVKWLAERFDGIVIEDGPLTYDSPRGQVLGYVKRLLRFHVGPDEQAVIPRLAVGQRSPLFVLGSNAFARYSWFLRLADPAPGGSPFSACVRMEVDDSIGLEPARHLADATALALPALAPGRHRDPRAPQNLYPIGALEGHLRRRLGDQRLVRRHIEGLIARGVDRGTS